VTESSGRHASSDQGETLILPAISGDEQPGQDRQAAGRHASGPAASDGERRPAAAAQGPPAAAAAQGPPADRGPEEPAGGEPAEARGPRSAAGQPSRATSPAPSAAPRSESAPDAARRAPGERRLRLAWVYPDLLSTYGDRGNMLVLIRRAQLRGIDVDALEVKSDEPVPESGDIYLLGGGEDLPQILAANRLRADGGLNRAADRGAVVFAVCAGYQLIGHQFGGVEGEPVAGLGILDATSGRGERRGVGEIVADVDPTLGVPRLTGFENHQGVTHLGRDARPLAQVTLGVGNGDGTEGAYAGNVLGTYLHGPALARNPGLADLLISWVVGPLRPLDPEAEEWAGRLRAERLAATAT
jgi:lipid II isoglutaminyl synthase (glutamine-hydrolysing)